MATEEQKVPSKYASGKVVKTDFIKIGNPESDEAKESEFEYRISVQGVILEMDKKNMSGGQVGSYKLQDEGEEVVSFLGSVELDDKLALLEVGDDVYIHFDGIKKSTTAGHSGMKMYTVIKAE